MEPTKMKRSPVSLEDVADWHTLAAAFHLAASGKPDRRDVRVFAAKLDGELAALRRDILEEIVQPGPMTSFRIRDPKPRIIRAPCFRDRVLHHALMAHAGPVLDRALVFDTYACRLGKGTLAAVRRCQNHARRFPWYGKIDVRAYFASIDHTRLMALLRRRFKNRGVLALMEKIIAAHHERPGVGLPIGALTSQHFANFYLGGLDRLLLERCRVGGMVRYMDDVVWWCDDRTAAREALAAARAFLRDDLRLAVKEPALIGQSASGLAFCGYRVLPSALLLSRRRRRRYAERRRHWEEAYAAGEIDAPALQAGFGSVLAITAHADAAAWRREQLCRRPLAEELCAV
jgi:retron-type reverse transcriptase